MKPKKDKIKQIAESLKLSILTYSQNNSNLRVKRHFTFDELMLFNAEANNYDLDLDEYIAMRIMG